MVYFTSRDGQEIACVACGTWGTFDVHEYVGALRC